MVTASIVLFKTQENDLRTILQCALFGGINKIYVVDNSPTDELRDIVISYSKEKIEYIFGQGNIGFGEANNIAMRKAINLRAKYHVVLNPDISFEHGTIEAIINYMDLHPEIGQLLPKVIYPDGKIQYLCKLLPTPLDIFGRRFLPRKIMSKLNNRYEMRWTNYNRVRNCPILSGCFMFLKMDVIKEVGMFDSRFFMYFEDFDLTRRIHKVSKSVYFPNVTIIHNHAAEHRHNLFLLKTAMKSAIIYFNKWGWIFDKERTKINIDALLPHNLIKD